MAQHQRACQICRTANWKQKEARLRGPLSLKLLIFSAVMVVPVMPVTDPHRR
jgi:hypothetical protein